MPHPRQIQVSISYICPALNCHSNFSTITYTFLLQGTADAGLLQNFWGIFFYDTYVLCKNTAKEHSLLTGQHFWPSPIFTTQHTNQGRHISANDSIHDLLTLAGFIFPCFQENDYRYALYFNKRAKAKETPACKNATFYWHVNLV